MRLLFLLVILCAVLPAHAIELTKGWCASASFDWVFFTSSQRCKNNRGQLYKQKNQAEVENERLKNCSSSSTSKGLVSSPSGDDGWVWCATNFGVSHVRSAVCRNKSGEAYKTKAQAQVERKRQRDCFLGSTSTVQSPSSPEKIWCATKNGVTRISSSECTTKQGKAYSYEHQAKAKHKRLKGAEYVWCATESSAVKIRRSSCDHRNGNAYSYEHQAKAEHKRLKGAEYVWCATESSAVKIRRSSCDNRNGNAYSYEHQAKAEHKRLKGQSTASSSSTNTYCHDRSHNLFYKTGGNRCSGSDKKISKREFSNRRLDSSSTTTTTSSSSKIWCATADSAFQTTKDYCKSRRGKAYSYEHQAKAKHKRLKGAEYVWCATEFSAVKIRRSSCDNRNGNAYSYEHQAKAEHKRLKGSSSSSSSSTASSSGSGTYCHDSSHNLFYKSGGSRCSGSDKKISKREYSNRRVDSSSSSSTASSTGEVWCATRKSVYYTINASCLGSGGKSYSSQSLAQAEHKRLKAASSSSSSTASSTGTIWCATKYSVSKTSRYSCSQNKGKVFWTYSSALAEKNRLNKSSSSSSTASSSGSGTYCHDSSHNRFYKSGGSRCSGSDKKISKREYSNRRVDSSSTTTTASSSNSNLVWCATNKWWRYTQKTSCRNAGGKIYPSQYEAVAATTTTASSSNKIWCATKLAYFVESRSACLSKGGKSYSHNDAGLQKAKAEHKRLKGAEYVWCATKYSAVKTRRSFCDKRNGKAYSYEHQAKAEHKRLKGSSSSSSKNLWCATNLAVWKLSSWSGAKDSCRKIGGKIFPSQYQAKAEFRRLSTASSSGKVWCATKTAYFVESSGSACQSLDGKHYAYNSVGLSSAKAEHKRLKGSSSSSTTTTASSSTLSEEAKKKYIDWAKSNMPAYDVALAIASNAWAGGRGKNVHEAKRAALDNCEKDSKGQTCRIIDVNLTTISSSSSSSFLKIGFIIAAVIVVLVFLGRLGKRSWQSLRTKTTGRPAPAREVAQPQPKVTPPARPKVEAPPKEDPRERLVGIDPSWSIDRKLKHVVAKFIESSDRLAILSEGPERTRLLEILNACGALKRKYES